MRCLIGAVVFAAERYSSETANIKVTRCAAVRITRRSDRRNGLRSQSELWGSNKMRTKLKTCFRCSDTGKFLQTFWPLELCLRFQSTRQQITDVTRLSQIRVNPKLLNTPHKQNLPLWIDSLTVLIISRYSRLYLQWSTRWLTVEKLQLF